MTRDGGLVLGGMVFYPGGEHVMSWRLPGSEPDAYLDVEYYVRFAQTLERGGFATLFIADELYVWDRFASGIDHAVNIRTEPFTLLGALSQRTEHIGLAATVSTTYNEPYHVARKLASIDHLSEGRAAWNLVTSASDEEAWNFGRDANLDHAVRYRRGAEFVDVVQGLWDSWDDDAFLYDQESGYFAKRDGLHVLDHEGEFFRVRGPLNIARPPQAHPVLFQAGASEAGRALAGAKAEGVFTLWQDDLADAQALYADYKRRAVEHGRDASSMLILPAVSPVIGDTEADALRQLDEIEELTPDRVSLDLLSHYLQTDLSDRPLDAPFEHVFDETAINQSKSVYESIRRIAAEATTLREVYRTILRRRFLPGTPEQIADWLTERYEQDAADGYMLAFSSIPVSVDRFVDQVVPELERRGVYDRAYRGDTLREHLGLARPASRYDGSAAAPAPAAVDQEASA
ncbi:LLM class flavin-dependent oxidoreductase [Curtobacterium sp. VKM Ac-2887]|uniref:LLM class flavin-dependent oxidoreductase n=1 Tax=Curtobacterium sp. VKM Ac-2887 TaxID=2783819 RepID=UPI00188DADBA|nr:LLM class flavin-dependent oxidoreductase [Curtobacterium sp. VKM Ac-2887]MBF4585970.1 LLM class flavin-dependent oxidoreductase [Curtobacterium sp. VKM Ac-2887]